MTTEDRDMHDEEDTDYATVEDASGEAAAIPGEPGDDPYDPSAPQPLFTGDTGRLPRKVRETLVAILKRKYISAEQHPNEWRIVLEHEGLLASILNDLFIVLVVDRTYEVAYKQQAVDETGAKFATLLYDREYNREETVLLVHLRRLLRAQQQAGDDQVFVDREDLVREVVSFRPATSTNQVDDEKKARNAVDGLLRDGLLLTTGEEDRLRISPIIEAVLPVERLAALAAWLRTENGTGHADTDGEEPDSAADGSETEVLA